MDKINQLLCEVMTPGAPEGNRLVKAVFADKRKKSQEHKKVTLRPVTIKGEYMYQAEFHFDKKVTHQNIPYYEVIDFANELMAKSFKQVNLLTETQDIQILASKPEKPRITRRDAVHKAGSLEHNRQKQYIIDDGKPVDFLVELGVMSPEGKVHQKHYSKFRQINRFLEIAEDSFEYLPKEGTLRIIDFGCGKSYLTFALYYYLKLVRNRNVEIIGLDLKQDVIEFCNSVAKKLGYDELKFLTGDIADYESDGADMVVTLHACDTATDYALINAVGWNSRVILSVPCCQHEMFSQIHEPVHDPMFKHGIIKDKFNELLTDSLRGLKLEACGYSVNMIEFTTLEHTAKNIMIKAVKTAGGKRQPDAAGKLIKTPAMKKASEEYEALKKFYGVSPTIDKLEI